MMLVKKEKGKRRKCVHRIGIIKKTNAHKVSKMGVEAMGKVPAQREVLRRHLVGAAEKKPFVSLSLCLAVNQLEIEHGLACAATCFWAQAVWVGQREEDMREAWERQVWDATSWKQSDNAPKLAFAEGGRWQNKFYVIFLPTRCQRTLLRHAKEVYWQHWTTKHEIGELEEGI